MFRFRLRCPPHLLTVVDVRLRPLTYSDVSPVSVEIFNCRLPRAPVFFLLFSYFPLCFLRNTVDASNVQLAVLIFMINITNLQKYNAPLTVLALPLKPKLKAGAGG